MNRFDTQDCHSECIVPRCELSLFGEAELAEGSRCGFQSQDVEDDLFQAGEIVSRKVFAHCGGVFAEVYVEHPVQAIFDSPVTANGFSLRIPTNLDSDSEPNWTRIPEQTGQSARSDAGFSGFTLLMS